MHPALNLFFSSPIYFLRILKEKLVIFYSVFLFIKNSLRVRYRRRVKYNLRSKFLTRQPLRKSIEWVTWRATM